MPDKTTRRFLAEQTETEEERLQLVLNQASTSGCAPTSSA